MSDDEIGDKGVEGLAQALRRNKSVRLVELCFNRISAAGAEALAKSVWGCSTLRALRLNNNQVRPADWLVVWLVWLVGQCGVW